MDKHGHRWTGWLLLLAAGLCLTVRAEAEISGAEIMEQVRMRMPVETIQLTGFIRTRKGRQNIDRALRSEIRFGDFEPNLRFQLQDGFGSPLTRARISWRDGVPVFQQWDAEDAPLPDAAAADEIADTGLNWSDLSLDFLWWEGAELAGRERIKTRSSHVVRIPAPPERPDLSAVRLWIDASALFVVRAELLGPEGKPVRRIDVDSLVEFAEGQWMVKDLIIRDYLNNRRMGVRFEKVVIGEEP